MTSHTFDTLGSSVLSSVRHRVVIATRRFAEWRAARARRARVTRELETYTDRELFDLGVSRANIPDIVNGTFRR
jgi:uncharacterized protein YjiS (DUF1127 family)